MKWPAEIALLRHGKSLFNDTKERRKRDPDYQRFRGLYEQEIALNKKRGAAEWTFSKEVIELARLLRARYKLNVSDADTPLTEDGYKQAVKTGLALREVFEENSPCCVFVSPYIRTRETLDGLICGWNKLGNARIIPDERIREREIGLLEIYTDYRIFFVLNPDQAQLRVLQGDFYYPYPQGESMVDVQFRTRQWFATLTRELAGKRVLAVTHHLTILGIRSLLERWNVEQFIENDHHHQPRNCSVSTYKCDPNQGNDGKLILESYDKIYY